jgi:hypothetical protein
MEKAGRRLRPSDKCPPRACRELKAEAKCSICTAPRHVPGFPGYLTGLLTIRPLTRSLAKKGKRIVHPLGPVRLASQPRGTLSRNSVARTPLLVLQQAIFPMMLSSCGFRLIVQFQCHGGRQKRSPGTIRFMAASEPPIPPWLRPVVRYRPVPGLSMVELDVMS